MKAGIYVRVSTEDQEREGTSLDSQLKACQNKAQELGYEIGERHTIKETYSGLSLDRPGLGQLRQWVRDRAVDVIVAYTLDRLSRDPVHFIILQEEMEKASVALVLVTEDIDSSDIGKLISHIRGYAAKLEATKIKERTMRGKRMRALSGKLPGNSHARLYGYSYVPGKGVGEGLRYVNEEQAAVVRNMFQWCLEGLSTNAITYRLREYGIPTPCGSACWIRSTVQHILKNPAYCGKTYAFTVSYGEPRYRLKPDTKRRYTGVIRKPKEEWVEIPDATPAIISEDIYNAVQTRLAYNKRMALRNAKRQYLLGGHIYCAKCGRAYWGAPGIKTRNGMRHEYPCYRCSGKCKSVTPIRCENRQCSGIRTEELIWAEVEKILTQPEVVFAELQRRKKEDRTGTWDSELQRVSTLISNRQKQKDRIHKAFYVTGDEALFRQNIAAITKEMESLEQERADLEERLASSKRNRVDTCRLKGACEMVRSNLKTLSFEEKRFVLSVLQVRVMVDGENLTLQGLVPLPEGQVVTNQSGSRHPGPRQGS